MFLPMKATRWEFTVVFGMIIGLAFALYVLDYLNETAVLANWLGPRLRIDSEFL